MRDQVAEVLAERAALDTGAAGGLIVSVLLHGSIAAAIVYAAFHQPVTQPVQSVNIKFAPMQQPVKAPPPATPRIEEPKPEPVKAQPTAAPPEKKTVPLSPFGQSRKKGSENPEKAIAAPSTQHAAPSPVEDTGVVFEGGDFPYTLYVDQMKRRIGSQWLRPQVGGTPKTVVYFIIERDGTIRDSKTEVSSGSGTFDRAALAAVLGASPLAPLPFGYNGTYLGVHLTFR